MTYKGKQIQFTIKRNAMLYSVWSGDVKYYSSIVKERCEQFINEFNHI